MNRLKQALGKYAADLILVAGAALVSIGAGMVYLPAGLICAGALAIGGAVLSCMGGGDGA